MNRFLQLPGEPVVGDNEVVIEVPHTIVAPMALELSLLLSGLADSLRMRAQSGINIVITVGAGVAVSKAIVGRGKADTLSFELGRNQAEYLHAVLLRAHRDGAAEVNHIHIEGAGGEDLFDLTILFETYREPMTREEAMKLMDD
jgi:hypothetical protein